MAFKLGSQASDNISNGEIRSKMRFRKDSSSIPGVPVIRKDLGEGIKGEANMDGSIFISNDIEPNSKEEREVLIHEMRHVTDMRIGKLKYEDYHVKWNGKTYRREDIDGKDMIEYEGKWTPAGSSELPWELEANNGNK